MPQVFKIGNYWVYFWANEGKPTEPIHIAEVIEKWNNFYGHTEFYC